jgi:hypothetical protein
MKRKFQSLFLPLALLFVFHLLHSPPAFADTDGSEIQVVSPSYLEVQLGPAFAGTEFQFRTDTGIYPGLIQVGEDGVLRLEIGGSSHYILSCVSTGMTTPGYIPQPEITSPPMSTPYVPDYQPAAQIAPVTQVESGVPPSPGTQTDPGNPIQTDQSTPLPVQSVPEEYVPEQISYEQPVEDIVYYEEEDYYPAIPMESLIILLVGLLVCIAVLIGLKLASPKSSDDDDFDDYDE